MITTGDKLRCLQRELHIRKQVYPNRILTKRMSKAKADYEIACIEAMINDYRNAALSEVPSSGGDGIVREGLCP